jgi:hypothetical protein
LTLRRTPSAGSAGRLELLPRRGKCTARQPLSRRNRCRRSDLTAAPSCAHPG